MTGALADKPGRISGEPLEVEIVEDVRRLPQLREAWDALFARAVNPAPALHPDWSELWLEINQDAYVMPGGLRMLCLRHAGRLVGMMPLYRRRPRRISDGGVSLNFIGTGEDEADELCSDYLDVLCEGDWREACAQTAWRNICGEAGRGCDGVKLSDIADHSALVSWARIRGPAVGLEVSPRGVCPLADLTGGFEAYLGRLSANTRQQMRRLLRQAETAGATFEVAGSPVEAELYFDEMVRLHQARWQADGQPGCFASERFARFHRRLVERWAPAGRALLSRVRQGGKTLAVAYGFRIGSKYDFYQSGVWMEESDLKSPGIVSFGLLMGDLCRQGVRTFDFLRGSSQYKQRLATGAQPLAEVRRVAWTWRAGLGVVAGLGERVARRIRRRVRGDALDGTPPATRTTP